MKKGDLANAEKSFLEAIAIDDKQVDAYNALATIYNAQKKFDDATKMGTKANELMSAAGGTAAAAAATPPPSSTRASSSGTRARAPKRWRSSRRPSRLDPKMADAQYMLGLTLYSTGQDGRGEGATRRNT